MKWKMQFAAAIFAGVMMQSICVQGAERATVRINGVVTAVEAAQSVRQGLSSGDNNISITYGEKMSQEQSGITTIAALFCEGVLANIQMKHSPPIGVDGEIPRADFKFPISRDSEKYSIKAFFFEDISELKPFKNPIKASSGAELASNGVIVDGKKIPVNTEKQEFASPKWIHIEENNGYVFLDEGTAAVTRENNRGTSYCVITKEHGENPSGAGYAYVILPKADADKTSRYAKEPDIEVVAADENVHAIRDVLTDSYYVNVFSGLYTLQGVELSPCSAIIKKGENVIDINVSDPTQKQNEIVIKLDRPIIRVTGADRHHVTFQGAMAKIDVSRRPGASFSFCLTVQNQGG